jgi:hypothetical protein
MSALEAADAGEEAEGASGGVAVAPEAGDIAAANVHAQDAPEAAMDIDYPDAPEANDNDTPAKA